MFQIQFGCTMTRRLTWHLGQLVVAGFACSTGGKHFVECTKCSYKVSSECDSFVPKTFFNLLASAYQAMTI